MVMKPEPWGQALDAVLDAGGPAAGAACSSCRPPAGRPFTQALAAELAAEPWLAFACGRYEGIDAPGASRTPPAHARRRGLASATTCSPAARSPCSSSSRRSAGCCPGCSATPGVATSRTRFTDGLLEGAVLHPAAGLARARGAAGAAVRRPRGDRPLAPRRGAAAYGALRPELLAGRRPLRRPRPGRAGGRGEFDRPARRLWQSRGLLRRAVRAAPRVARPAPGPCHRPRPLPARAVRPKEATPTCTPSTSSTPLRCARDVPDFRPGDTLDVDVRVVEGNRSRVQRFQGVVIRRQGGGVARDLHGPQGQLRRRRGAHLPGAHPGHRGRSRSSPAVTSVARSSTTCASCAARRPRSRRSATPRRAAKAEARSRRSPADAPRRRRAVRLLVAAACRPGRRPHPPAGVPSTRRRASGVATERPAPRARRPVAEEPA